MFLKTILSCILPTPLRSDIGLKFDGQELSPFLGKVLRLILWRSVEIWIREKTY